MLYCKLSCRQVSFLFHLADNVSCNWPMFQRWPAVIFICLVRSTEPQTVLETNFPINSSKPDYDNGILLAMCNLHLSTNDLGIQRSFISNFKRNYGFTSSASDSNMQIAATKLNLLDTNRLMYLQT